MHRASAVITILAALFLALLASLPAQAQAPQQAGIQVRIKVLPGGMSVTTNGNPLDFGTISVANGGQTVTGVGVMTLTVTDSSGTARGWNLTLQASDLTDGKGVIPAQPNLRFTPNGGTITAASGQPVDGTHGPREVDSGTQSLGTPIRVVSANPGYGQGVYVYTPAPGSFSLTIPQGLEVGTGNFSGTMTATVQTGP